MKQSTAIKIYQFILKEMNGWSQEEVEELSISEIMCDPIYEGIKKIGDEE